VATNVIRAIMSPLDRLSGVRGDLSVLSSAGSFLGGFRTPAAGGCCTAVDGRHPKPAQNRPPALQKKIGKTSA
jgi:hypothetical protein